MDKGGRVSFRKKNDGDFKKKTGPYVLNKVLFIRKAKM